MTRRANHTGSLRAGKREGTWQSRAANPDRHEPGQPQTLAHTWHNLTRAEAEKAHAEWVAQVLRHEVGPKGPTLAQHVVDWLAQLQTAPSTAGAYRAAINRALPYLGHIHLRDIDTRTVERALAAIHAAGHAPATVGHTKKALASAMNLAVRWGIVRTNPVSAAVAPRAVAAGSEQVPTVEQMRALIAAEQQPERRALWVTMAGTGMRRGELIALRWAQVDLDAKVIDVVATITTDHRGRQIVGETTKTRKPRRVPIGDDVVAELRAYRALLAETRLPTGQSFVWPGDKAGRPLVLESLGRWWRLVRRRAGLPDTLTPHGVRHLHATTLVSAGVPVNRVAERMGHSAKEVLTRYGIHVPAGDRSALEHLPRFGEAR